MDVSHMYQGYFIGTHEFPFKSNESNKNCLFGINQTTRKYAKYGAVPWSYNKHAPKLIYVATGKMKILYTVWQGTILFASCQVLFISSILYVVTSINIIDTETYTSIS